MRTAIFILLIWLVCLGGNSVIADDMPHLKITTNRENDLVEVKVDQDDACVTIRSPVGISGAAIQRVDTIWPAKMTLRLYLRGLESLKVGNGTATISASVASHADSPIIRVWLDDQEDQPLLKTDHFFMTIRKQQLPADSNEPAVGCFEVELPAALFEANPATIQVDWIDFYR